MRSNTPTFAFPRTKRVSRGPEIERVRQQGKRLRTASMDVRVIASLHACGRVGIIVPRYGHSAVDRNLVKRRLREIIRVETLRVLPTVDVVLRVFPRAYTRSFGDLQGEVRKWTRQLVANPPVANPPSAAPLVVNPPATNPGATSGEPSSTTLP